MLELQAEKLTGERGARPIFADLSFSLQGGELGTVIGANGLGKTTLLRILSGLSPAASGKYRLQSPNSSALSNDTEHQVSFVADVPGLHSALTVFENLNWACEGKLDSTDPDVISIFKAARVYHLLQRQAGQLSRGQKQRVGLLRAILQKRSVWLLDEPFAHLDDDGQAWFVSCLRAHLDAQGIAILTAHSQPNFLRSQTFDDQKIKNIRLQAEH